MKEKRLLTLSEASKRLGIARDTVKVFVQRGCLRAVNKGRGFIMVDANSIEALFDDLRHLEEMRKNISQLKEEYQEAIAEKKEAVESATEDNDLFSIIRHSNINARLIHAIVQSLGDNFLTLRESDMIRKYLQKWDLVEVAKEYDISVVRAREIINRGISKLWSLASYSDIVAENNSLKEERSSLTAALEHLTNANKELKIRCGELDDETAAILEKYPISEKEIEICELLSREIREFDFSARTLNCLIGWNLETIGDMVQLTDRELLKLRNFGKKSLREIEEFAEEHGLCLGMDVDGLKSRYALHLARQNKEKECV